MNNPTLSAEMQTDPEGPASSLLATLKKSIDDLNLSQFPLMVEGLLREGPNALPAILEDMRRNPVKPRMTIKQRAYVEIRDAIARALGAERRWGGSLIEPVWKVLVNFQNPVSEEPPDIVIKASAMSLGYLTGRRREMFRFLVGNVKFGKDWRERAASAYVLGWWQNCICREILVAFLADVLDDDHHSVRGNAAQAIGFLARQGPVNSTPIIPKLLQLLGDDHAIVRASAAFALGELDPNGAAPQLMNLARDDRSFLVVNRAIEALGKATSHANEIVRALYGTESGPGTFRLWRLDPGDEDYFRDFFVLDRTVSKAVARLASATTVDCAPLIQTFIHDFADSSLPRAGSALRQMGPAAVRLLPELFQEVQGTRIQLSVLHKWRIRNVLRHIDKTADCATIDLKHGFLFARKVPGDCAETLFGLFSQNRLFLNFLYHEACEILKRNKSRYSPGDLVNTALLILARRVRNKRFKLRPEAHMAFVSWLQTISYRLIIDASRELSRELKRFDQRPHSLLHVAKRHNGQRIFPLPDSLSQSDQAHPLDTAIGRFLRNHLDARQLTVLQLRLQGKTHQEIGGKLGTSREVPSRILQNIQLLLREKFGEDLPFFCQA